MDLGDPDQDLDRACRGVDCIVHLAAHVHVPAWRRIGAAGRFHAVNAAGTGRLARAAVRQGVRRFVYLSTIGVHGAVNAVEAGAPRPFGEDDAAQPGTAYALSKYEGECLLRDVCRGASMTWTILRAPLVFGPGAGGNFRRLLDAVWRGLPLPLDGGDSLRSLLYVDNLAALVERCLESPAAANTLFLAADHDYSVARLAASLAAAFGRPLRPVRAPPAVWRLLQHVPLAGPAVRGLTQPLQVDSSCLRRTLGWSPPVDADTAVARTAEWYVRMRTGTVA